MAKLKVYSEIVDSDTKVLLEWNGFNSVSSDDIVKFVEAIPADDNEIHLHIHCPGGQVWEGWRMYDALRQSGKTITTVVEGLCASMATILMLAAPKERRYAYPNATFLIHNPAASYLSADMYKRLTADNVDAVADKLKVQAEQLRDEQQRIINTYVERTGCDAETLQTLMDNETIFDAAKAKELGFITDTLAPNTASVTNHFYMNKNEAKVEVGQSWLDRLIAKAGFGSREAVKFNDLTFTAANGESFSVEREEGQYAVGDTASPDGSYVMEDGSTVTISEGVISDIAAPKAELKNPATDEVITEEEAQQLLNDLYVKVAELEEAINELKTSNDEASASAAEELDKEKKKCEENEQTISDLNNQIEVLKAEAIDDEAKSILDIVAKGGGKEWLAKVSAMQSNGSPSIPQSDLADPSAPKFGDSFKADLAKKSKRFRVGNN